MYRPGGNRNGSITYQVAIIEHLACQSTHSSRRCALLLKDDERLSPTTVVFLCDHIDPRLSAHRSDAFVQIDPGALPSSIL